MEHTIVIEPVGKQLSVPHGYSLMEALRQTDVEFPCGGCGRCGNCRVELLSGDIAMTEAHAAILRDKGFGSSWRLACMSKVEDDIVIRIPRGAMSITADDCCLSFVPEKGLGIAIDLGSTTVVGQLVDMETGTVLRTESGINPQVAYGADIISRISYCMRSEENLRELSSLTRDFIGSAIIERLCRNGEAGQVRQVVIAGNTVMHHIFAALDLGPLSVAPFCSPHNEGISFLPSELSPNLPPDSNVLFLPNITHFIGSDVLCGIHHCGMQHCGSWQLLIDLGTNGEMALGCRDRILCASTAAGPAFEGINITCGMRAMDGAVYAIDGGADGRPLMHTVADVAPRGFCGSGLVEAVHYLFSNGIIDFAGAFTDVAAQDVATVSACSVACGVNGTATDSLADALPTRFYFDDNVFLDIRDVREFQLAKAALAAGVDILMEQAGIVADDIENIYITGGLGYYINIGKMQQLGMFEQFSKERFHKLPNSSLAGAKELLFRSRQTEVEGILSLVEHCPLESVAAFQNVFCEKMFFPFM